MRIVQEALTFDDVLLLPAHSSVLPRDVSLASRLTRGIDLQIPVLSAAMDTVTESRLAITLAQEGGVGIIHKNMTSDQQAAGGRGPVVVAPDRIADGSHRHEQDDGANADENVIEASLRAKLQIKAGNITYYSPDFVRGSPPEEIKPVIDLMEKFLESE